MFLSPRSSSTFLVDQQGLLWACGRNDMGQLGLGNLKIHSIPKRVAIKCFVKEVVAGECFAVLLDSSGTLWGSGLYSPNYNPSQAFVKIPNFPKIEKLVCTQDSWLAIDESGRVKSTFDVSSKFESIGPLHTIIMGKDYTMAQSIDYNIFAWGDNSNGKLGIKGPETIEEPRQIDILGISRGLIRKFFDYCDTPLIWDSDGILWCFNANLTYNTVFNKKICNSVACGALHCLVIDNEGSLWGWGYNGAGELGYISRTVDYCYPQKYCGITFSPSAIVAAGDSYSMILCNGILYASGCNAVGQLGLREFEDEDYNPFTQHHFEPRETNATAKSARK